MNQFQRETITELVHTISKKANITNQEKIHKTIDQLCSMSVNDSIDYILVSLNDLLERKMITREDFFSNVGYILQLDPKKYKSSKDLIDRFHWIKGMNLEHPSMSLTENHQLVIETFDQFNQLLQGRFDCYYTGGFIGYLAVNRELERFHGDLDLYINEQQLISLKELVDANPDFQFVSNMSQKKLKGHEYKIVYKKTPMNIGLFLFERTMDHRIITKEYYYEQQNGKKQLFVNERHYSKKYTEMAFSDSIRFYHGNPYKMVSLEQLYNSKKGSRFKDEYDAKIIKENINMRIANQLEMEMNHNCDVIHRPISNSIVNQVEQ